MAITGVNAPVIQYYPDASFLPQEKILKNIRDGNDLSRNRLYLESNNQRMEENGQAENNFSYKILNYNPNSLSLSYDAAKNGYLYYSDCYDTYWDAYVDNVKTNIYKANGAFKAIKISAGTHKVFFNYNPRYFRISLWFYYVTFCFCLLYLIVGALKNMKR